MNDKQAIVFTPLLFELSKALDRVFIRHTLRLHWRSSGVAGLRVSGVIWGELVKRERVEWPRDWREAFKTRWFPEWAQRRWPVQRHEVVLDKRALRGFRPALPEKEHILVVYRHEHDLQEEWDDASN